MYFVCLVGTYSSMLAASSATSCTNCPANSVSTVGSIIDTACQCNAGFTGANGNTCSQCNINQFKAVLGSAICTNCPSNSVSLAGSIANTACQCNAGSLEQMEAHVHSVI